MAPYLLEISYTLVVAGLLYYFLLKSQTLHTKRKLVLHWGLFGFVVNFYSFSWLYTLYPITWMQGGLLQILGITIVHFTVAVASGVCFTVVALSHYSRIKKGFLPLFFAVTLVVAEVFRSLLLSIIFYGNGSTVAFHYTAGTVGNALSTTPLIEFAYFGGTFALTFVLGYLMYCLLSKKHFLEYRLHLAGIFIFFLVVHFLVPITLPHNGTSVGIITTNFKDPDETNYSVRFKEQSQSIHTLTLSLLQASSTFIVYPEDSRYISYLPQKEREVLSEVSGKTVFIDGDTILTKDGYKTISFFYYPRGDKKVGRGKDFLLPFNEYMPTLFRGIILPFVGREKMVSYEKYHTFTPTHSDKSILVDGSRVGTLICSEILSYSMINGLHKEKPDIVFFQAHLNVFHNNPWFVMHLRSFTKIAAAQLRTSVITSTSGAPSYIISPHGSIIKTLPVGLHATTYRF